MSAVRKGTEFEREIKRLLEYEGYDCTRAAASKGKFAGMATDLICTKRTRVNKQTRRLVIVGIQAKVRKR
jgi:Holliday junction resolvase